MSVEFEMAFHRDMAPQEKLSHLRTAEQHGWDASYNARQSSNSGLLAQVQLYMAIIKGRSAQVHERLGVAAQEIRKQKDDALSEIGVAMERVREHRPTKVQESIDFAETWTKILSPTKMINATPPPPAAVPNTAASTITPSIPVAELDTSRLKENITMPSCAELGVSGHEMTTATYLLPESSSPRHR